MARRQNLTELVFPRRLSTWLHEKTKTITQQLLDRTHFSNCLLAGRLQAGLLIIVTLGCSLCAAGSNVA